jgi:hypothetical protein
MLTFMSRRGEKSAQLYHDIDNIMTQQQRKFGFFYSQWFQFGALLLFVSEAFFADRLPKYLNEPFVGLMVLLVVSTLWASFIRLRRHSVVRFERRNEAQTFLTQNRNAIALTIVTSLISGAIGYGFAKLKDGLPLAPAVTTPPSEAPK